jgi:hypothetical protein
MSEEVITNPFVDIYAPGEKAIYDLMNVTFLIDEELTGWREIHDWIRALTFPFSYEEYKNLSKLNPIAGGRNNLPQYSDAQLTLLSSSNQPIIRFKFFDVFPIAVSSFVMSSTDTPDQVITADATFRYSLYDII